MGFKDAGPCPLGTDKKQWGKTYNAADSRMYRRMGKDASKSAAARASGETRRLALKMLAQSVHSSVQTSSAVLTSSTHQSVMNAASKSNAKVSDNANSIRVVHSVPQDSSKLSSTATSSHKFSSAATSSQPTKFPSNSMAPPPQKRKLATEDTEQLTKRNKANPPEDQITVYAKALERKLKEMEALWVAIDEAEAATARAEANVQKLYHQLKFATTDMEDAIKNLRHHRIRKFSEADPREG